MFMFQQTNLAEDLDLSEYEDNEELFNQRLQEFANEVGIICALENGNKIAPKDAYRQIKILFKQLKLVKRSVYPKK